MRIAGPLFPFVLVSALWATPTIAHDWYPAVCCSGMDCAPVTSQRWVAGALYDSTGKAISSPRPEWEVTTKIGTGIVPPDMPRQLSQDSQMHACIRNTGMGSYVICVFVPPGM